MLSKNKKEDLSTVITKPHVVLKTIKIEIIHAWKRQITFFIFFNSEDSVGSCWFFSNVFVHLLYLNTFWEVKIQIFFLFISAFYWITAFFVTVIYTLIHCNQTLEFVANISANMFLSLRVATKPWISLIFTPNTDGAVLKKRAATTSTVYILSLSHYWADRCWRGSTGLRNEISTFSVLPAHWGNAVSRRWSHDRVLCAHGHGDGNIFPLLLRHGLGFLQPKTEQRRGGEWDWERNCARFGQQAWFHTADVQCRWTHTLHLCQLLGGRRRSVVRLFHVLPWRWWNYQPHWKWHGLNSWWLLVYFINANVYGKLYCSLISL